MYIFSLKQVGDMNIEILTTLNKEFDNIGFGNIQASNNVFDAIKKTGHTVKLTVCQTLNDLNDVVQRKPDLVILTSKYMSLTDEDDIWLSEYFDKHDINYSGSSRETLKYDSDNELAKSYLRTKGVNTVKYFTAIPGEYKSVYDLPIGFPLYLKPLNGANSSELDNLYPINNFNEYQTKISSLYESFNSPVLVEECIDGQEFTVALIKENNDNLLVSAIEIIKPELTTAHKVPGEKVKIPKEIKKDNDITVINRVKTLAMDAYIDLNIRDFGLIDIKINKNGHCFFMKANLVPDMSDTSSYFAKACEIEHSLSYDNVIELIVNEGLSRVTAI